MLKISCPNIDIRKELESPKETISNKKEEDPGQSPDKVEKDLPGRWEENQDDCKEG